MADEGLITVGEARRILGVSTKKMAALLKQGLLKAEPDPLDNRIKRVRRLDVERLRDSSLKNAA